MRFVPGLLKSAIVLPRTGSVTAITIVSVLLLYYDIGNSNVTYRRKPMLENRPFGQP